MLSGPSAFVPPNVGDFEVQEQRCLKQLESKSSDIEKFIYLSTLRSNDADLFYRLALKHFIDIAPLVYTPTVGDACLQWSEIYQQPEGMYLSYDQHKGKVADVLKAWPQDRVAMTVITDGSRILGLGDIGVNGMGIPIGKLCLYVACAGIDPGQVLPIHVDLGTSDEELRKSKFYLGARRGKNSREEEEAFLDELTHELTQRWPDIVIQFEDWAHPWYTLEKYREKYTMFNE
jgi:malate dehydrogenase (oxaloacetate-decarboxylating)(NADP+)